MVCSHDPFVVAPLPPVAVYPYNASNDYGRENKRMTPTQPTTSLLMAALAGLLVITGCGSSKISSPLSPASFQDRSGLKAPEGSADTQPVRKPVAPRVESPIAPALVGASLGQYQTLGGIVAEVNGYPISANKVLRQLRPELAARATEMDEQQFRNFVIQEVSRKITGLERDELVYGAADRILTDEERKMATYMTMQWRTRQISEAGGSVELARLRASVDGNDFDELVAEQYRRQMTEVFYRRKVVPRIQISANDLRDYYNANREREFAEPEQITFRLIKIDAKTPAGKTKAKQRAEEIMGKLQTQDFAEIARTMNDDLRLAQSGGQEAPLKRGDYRLGKVETALWETPVGKTTGIIEDSGGLYIGKVEARKEGKVYTFEDSRVQDRIYRNLWSRQFRKLTDEIELNLRKNSMVREGKEMTQIAVEMVMQEYPAWSKKP